MLAEVHWCTGGRFKESFDTARVGNAVRKAWHRRHADLACIYLQDFLTDERTIYMNTRLVTLAI
jgi:hypothetical protein